MADQWQDLGNGFGVLKRTASPPIQRATISDFMAEQRQPQACSLHSPSPSTSSAWSAEEQSAVSTPPNSPPCPSSSCDISQRVIAPLPQHRRTASRAVAKATSQVEIKLLFSNCEATPTPATEASSPPAFFPNQRIAFAPKLRVVNRFGASGGPNGGLLLADCMLSANTAVVHDEPEDTPSMLNGTEDRLCSMMLGVVGLLEILEPPSKKSLSRKPIVKSTRVIADFCTDLSNGVKIWQKDANSVINKRRHAQDGSTKRRKLEACVLPPGTFVLPLSMKIPASDKLPPSFESDSFRLSYTMTLALFTCVGPVLPAGTKPKLLTAVTYPFHVLPSTLPSLPPSLPALKHSPPAGFGPAASSLLSSMAKLAGVSSADPREEPKGEWSVQTFLPTSSFSPSEVVPITLAITSPVSSLPSTSTQQIFIRLTLLRKLFVRESPLSLEQDDEWGLGALGNDVIWERWEREELELCQRWGLIHLPATASSTSAATTLLKDIPLPLSSLFDAASLKGHSAGYSTTLDLTPGANKPNLVHGDSSWFAPAVVAASLPANAKSWDKHAHVSCRFFVAVELGFFPSLTPAPASSPLSAFSGGFAAQTCPSPFAPRDSRSLTASSTKPGFPGKLRELLVPITIGSVAEPGLSCFAAAAASTGTAVAQADADAIMHSRQARAATPNAPSHPFQGEERGATGEGEDGNSRSENQLTEQSWLVPPPDYASACNDAPCYV